MSHPAPMGTPYFAGCRGVWGDRHTAGVVGRNISGPYFAGLQCDFTHNGAFWIAQFLAVCRRSKMMSMGTRRPQRGSRLFWHAECARVAVCRSDDDGGDHAQAASPCPWVYGRRMPVCLHEDAGPPLRPRHDEAEEDFPVAAYPPPPERLLYDKPYTPGHPGILRCMRASLAPFTRGACHSPASVTLCGRVLLLRPAPPDDARQHGGTASSWARDERPRQRPPPQRIQ